MVRSGVRLFAVILCWIAPAAAQGQPEPGDTVVVYGRALDLIGEARSASEGVIGYADFEDHPLARVGELVEVIPGAVATQHSGEGKANQYFLRGFNLDHGTDFSVSVDGVPVNLRTHGHGHGYLDLNFVIPEIVEQVRYRKGPFFADAGDFSSAGSAAYSTYRLPPHDFLELRAGEHGYLRAVGAVGLRPSPGGSVLLAAEGQVYDGPWELEQNLEKLNLVARFHQELDSGRFGLAATAYDSRWTSTDQIPERAVRSGVIDRLGFIDGDLGGETSRLSLSAWGEIDHAPDAATFVQAYLIDYDFALFSNFTYFLDDPVNGDEFEQRDRRTVFGGEARHSRPLGPRVDLRAGVAVRHDDIGEIGLHRTAARRRLSTVREDDVSQTSFALWGEVEAALSDRLRATVGLRTDAFEADVASSSEPANSGEASEDILSGTLGLAWRASRSVELYSSYGQGFHSNDVRGAVIRIDPATGDPAAPVPILVRSEAAEFGARIERRRWNAALAAFWLTLESELVFIGDAGSTEPNDGSERVGVEASGFIEATPWLTFDAAAAWTDARFDTAGPDDSIPGSVGRVFSAGAGRVHHRGQRFGDLGARTVHPRP